MTYWFVSTPFRLFPLGHAAAYRLACEETARLLKAGIGAFSPIAHGQGLSDFGGIDPIDNDIWMTINSPMMDAACGIIVVEAESWSISQGMAAEIDYFESHGKPVIAMTPGIIPAALSAGKGG